MTREEKELNCLNCRIGDFKHSLCDCDNGFCMKYKGIGKEEDLFKAIEALSERTGEWQCKSLSTGELFYGCSECGNLEINISNYCPNCGARMEKGDK